MKKTVTTLVCLMFVCQVHSQNAVHEWEGEVKQAATLIGSDPEAAEDAFDELLKGKNKKNVALLVDIGNAYLKEGDVKTAKEYAERAKAVDKECAFAYILSGDVAMAQNDLNLASIEYNQAIYFDEDCCVRRGRWRFRSGRRCGSLCRRHQR